MGAGTKIVDTYYNITVRVPKRVDTTHIINKVLVGKRADTGEPITGLYKKFDTEKIYYGEVPNVFTSGTYGTLGTDAVSSFNFSACENYNFTNLIQENNIYELTNRQVSFSVNGKNKGSNDFITNWGTPTISKRDDLLLQAIGTWTIQSDGFQAPIGSYEQSFNTIESDLSEVTYKDENDYFVFYNIKILFMRTMYACCSAIALSPPIFFGKTYPAKVVKIVQRVNSATITVYGNTLGIKLVEETHTIGDKSKAGLMYFPANELIQTTNTYGGLYKTTAQPLIAKNAVQPIFKPTEKINEWDNFDIPIYNGYVNLPALQKYRYVGSENCANKLAENSLATIYFIPTYVNTTVSIPIRKENEEVSHIIIGGGIDEEYGVCGTPIKVHLYGKVNKGKAHATLTYDGKTKKGDIDLDKIVCEEEETTMQDYTLQTKQSYSCNNAYLEYELNSKDNVHTTTAIRTYDDHIEVDLTILIGLKVIKLGAIYDTSTTENITADMNGVYEEYICGYCELTIYGATKKIEIKENNNET